MNHKECRDLFVEAVYGVVPSHLRPEFNDHLSRCSECRLSFDQLKGVAAAMNQRSYSPPTPAEWTSFWNTLEPALKSAGSSVKESWIESFLRFVRLRPAWTVSVAAVLLLSFGIVIGQRMIRQPLSTEQLNTGLSAAERILLNERAINYLERSKVLLLGIVNSSSLEPASGLLKEQQVSRMLVSEAAELKNSLSDADEQRMKQLITDLEVILLQIANLEEEKGFPAVEIVRSGVERRGILLKINLEQMRSQETTPAESPKQKTTEIESRI